MIEIKNLCKSYSKENNNSAGKTNIIKAIDDISLTIAKGEFIAIVGPSGSGKSTLMNILGLLDIPDSGNYKFEGREVNSLKIDELADIRNKKIGFVFQQFHLLPKTTAKENVELPLIYSDKKKIDGLAEKALKIVGLEERMYHLSSELSGGQQQRVAIARALVNDPDIILADEPTGNLDSKMGEDIISIFKELNRSGKTIILITHDLNIANNANRVLSIVDGKIIDDTVKTKNTYSENLS